MKLIPKYTRAEIIKLVKQKVLDSNEDLQRNSEKINIPYSDLQKVLSLNAIWTPKEYQLASKILEISVETLLENLEQEDLSNVSFRALENNEEINNKVSQLNDIFEELTYQLKIGSEIDGRKI
ncbi:hypothetical protein [Staphylococcus equorum]|uniref:hypothetical protein n=1 Tax=Staphylococcus equorum TaxID=246432 RepID=UPI000D1C6317|nr:hypothetical protein [Staphylococcus equorum]MDK9857353.1 hypothetical protein [Staphylococcus equorum]MDK9873971.1 hypothetical protein [Staphylococcus equorum]PTE25971.1 hypothetical protein BUY91_12585 [Staphylococcus equorum]PTE89875.1 hypothetical protein BUY89_13795 [Staphylococcus equorum]